MKKIRTPAILFLFLSILCLVLCRLFLPRKPFRKLDPAQILSATVTLTPPDKTLLIPDLTELVTYLNDTVIYRQDDSYTEYCGQGVLFTLFMQDGTQQKIMAYNPFLVINGVGYRTKYGPCEALNAYANRLLRDDQTVVVLNEPPVLNVISGETCLPTVQGSYAWQRQNPDGTFTETQNDCAHLLDDEEFLLPFETAEATATLRFAQEPDEILNVRCWNDAHWSGPVSDGEAVDFAGNRITLKPGKYIYEVTARWDTENGYGGAASWFFHILYRNDLPDGICRKPVFLRQLLNPFPFLPLFADLCISLPVKAARAGLFSPAFLFAGFRNV